jgi:hypothetical protein
MFIISFDFDDGACLMHDGSSASATSVSSASSPARGSHPFQQPEVAHEIDVTIVWNLSEGLRRLVESNVFFDRCQSVSALDELLFPPAIETVPNTGFSFRPERASVPRAQERLGLLIVVKRTTSTETQASFHVLDTGGRSSV